jgi:hypothetical protein
MNICSSFDELKVMSHSKEINFVKWLRVNMCLNSLKKFKFKKREGNVNSLYFVWSNWTRWEYMFPRLPVVRLRTIQFGRYLTWPDRCIHSCLLSRCYTLSKTPLLKCWDWCDHTDWQSRYIKSNELYYM